MLLLPPCPRQWAGYANFTHSFTFHHGVNQGFRHHPKQSAPVHDTAPRTPTCLKTISASRLPHLPPPGQPSLATNVPRLLDGAVNGLLATAAPPIDQVHSGSIVIVVACWSDKVLQAVGCTMIRRSRDACLKRITFSHVRSCLGHWAS